MTLPDFLKRGSMGEVRFEGSRIDLYFVIDAHLNGSTPEVIAIEYDTLSLYVIRKAIAFYEANRDEVGAYVRAWEANRDAVLATLPRVDVEQLRARLAERETAAAGEVARPKG